MPNACINIVKYALPGGGKIFFAVMTGHLALLNEGTQKKVGWRKAIP